jgi:hypothetical protein
MGGAIHAFPGMRYKPDIHKLADIMEDRDDEPGLLVVETIVRLARQTADEEDTPKNNRTTVNCLAVAYLTLARRKRRGW